MVHMLSSIRVIFCWAVIKEVDVVPYSLPACHRRRRMPIPIPTMLRWSDILPIGHNIGILFLIFCALISVQQYILLLLQGGQVEVEDSYFHEPRFPCTVIIKSHGKHCEFSMNLGASIDRLLVQVPRRFQTVLHALVQFSCYIEFSNFWNPAILFALFRMPWTCLSFFLPCGF